MKCRDFYYVNINIQESEVVSCGAQFSEFIEFIPVKPRNILLMKGRFWGGNWHRDIGLDYVDSKNMSELISDDVYSYGDFCWIDYRDKKVIDTMLPIELSELLYISHRNIPLHTPFFERINNNYVYLAHDDDYWTKIYMKNIYDYKKVIEGKILKSLKGRKKQITPIPEDIMNLIFDGASEGIVIDFPDSYCNSRSTGVSIYKIGKYRSYDQVHDVFERKKDCLNIIVLEYNNKTWKTYHDWK